MNVHVAVITRADEGTAIALFRRMQTIERVELCAVCGGDGETATANSAGPVRDENTGLCGPGPWGFGRTEECRQHDDCVGTWDQRLSRVDPRLGPAAHVICAPLLGKAAISAVRCAVNPYCPK